MTGRWSLIGYDDRVHDAGAMKLRTRGRSRWVALVAALAVVVVAASCSADDPSGIDLLRDDALASADIAGLESVAGVQIFDGSATQPATLMRTLRPSSGTVEQAIANVRVRARREGWNVEPDPGEGAESLRGTKAVSGRKLSLAASRYEGPNRALDDEIIVAL